METRWAWVGGGSVEEVANQTIRAHFDVYDATLTTQLSADQIISQAAQKPSRI